MKRQEALNLLHSKMQSVNLRRHCYAVGAVMKALAVKLGGDPDTWEILGFLHDIDWEETKDLQDEHTKRTLNWLKDLGETEGPVVHALMSHNTKRTHLAELEGNMEWALETCDELTGFIVAVALVRPEKKLSLVTPDSIRKKWKQKAFAAGVNRDQIARCKERLGIPLNDFIQIALSAMQGVHEELDL